MAALTLAAATAGLACVAAFVSEAKASGLVGRSIARAGLRRVTVAP